MSEYFLTKMTVEDLSEIWEYTYENWLEYQVNKYYYKLLDECKELADNQDLGRIYKNNGIDIFSYISGKHIIFTEN